MFNAQEAVVTAPLGPDDRAAARRCGPSSRARPSVADRGCASRRCSRPARKRGGRGRRRRAEADDRQQEPPAITAWTPNRPAATPANRTTSTASLAGRAAGARGGATQTPQTVATTSAVGRAGEGGGRTGCRSARLPPTPRREECEPLTSRSGEQPPDERTGRPRRGGATRRPMPRFSLRGRGRAAPRACPVRERRGAGASTSAPWLASESAPATRTAPHQSGTARCARARRRPRAARTSS